MNVTKSPTDLLSEITVYNKYARHDEQKSRRETWDEIVDRYILMMLGKYGTPNDIKLWENKNKPGKISRLKLANWRTNCGLSDMGFEIMDYAGMIYDKKVLPSMRALQFAGLAIERNHARLYNCCYLPVKDLASFHEITFLLLSGCVPPDTKLITKDGLTPIKDINIGDMVLSFNKGSGKYEYKRVKLTHDVIVSKDDNIKIYGHYGSFVTSKKHPVLVLNQETGEWVYKKAGFIKEGDIIKKYHNLDKTNITQDDWSYFAGALMGDGTCRYSKYDSLHIRFTADDEATIKNISEVMSRISGEEVIYKPSTAERYETDVWVIDKLFHRDSDFAQKYHDLGLPVGKKTYNTFIPNFVKASVTEDRNKLISFIAGLVDTDGYVSKDKKVYIASSSDTLKEELAAYLPLIGIYSWVKSITPESYNGTGFTPLKTMHRIYFSAGSIFEYKSFISHPLKRDRITDHQRNFRLVIPDRELDTVTEELNMNSKRKWHFLNRCNDSVASTMYSKAFVNKNANYDHYMSYDAVIGIEDELDIDENFKDITVEDNHNYVCGEGSYYVLHNCGVGFSVRKHHIDQLPPIKRAPAEQRFFVNDTIEGWAMAVRALINGYFGKNDFIPRFDYRDIRPKGSKLKVSGGTAPGPEPLRIALDATREILESIPDGTKLSPIQAHDIICHISQCVSVGGVRSAAMISLFSPDDDEMINAKSGMWWKDNIQRARSNNSAVFNKHKMKRKDFMDFWDKIKDFGTGEPGVFYSDDDECGTNPCKPLDATILTPDGYITFADALKLDELEVITPDGRVVKASKPFMTGVNRDIYEITLTNGMKLLGTDNHLHMNQKGDWVRMDELKVGDRLKIGNTKHYDIEVTNQKEYEDGMLHGWMLGDGWNFDRSDCVDSKSAGLSFGVNEFDCIDVFESMTGNNSKDHYYKPDTCKILSVPQNIIKYSNKWELPHRESQSYKLGFIRALFTTDGSVRNRNNVELYSVDREMLEGVNLILQEFGIRATITTHNKARSYVASDGKMRNNRETFKINVHSGQFKRIGFLSKFKQNLVEQQNDKGLSRRIDFEQVKSIKIRSNEDVYDITVYDECHAFIDNGIISHNCCEISLLPYQFCNLGEINTANIGVNGTVTKDHEQEFYDRCEASAFFCTLQAGFTDFHYLRPIWKETTEREALIGVSNTGIGDGEILILREHFPNILINGAELVKKTNKRVTELIGINPAARCTTVKPSGNSSCVLGCASGIHSRHSGRYIRNTQTKFDSALAKYFFKNHPNLIKIMDHEPDKAVIGIPIESPKTAVLRENETAILLLERIKIWNLEWVRTGHRDGINYNNVSATVSIRPDEWDAVAEWLWDHRATYNGIAFMPYDGGTYKDAPYMEITEEEYLEKLQYIDGVNIIEIDEYQDATDLNYSVACAGGACEI
jgi:intein/homing endonuclease